jgi:hypothetical protein
MLSAGNDNNWVIVAPGAPDETSSFVSHDEIEILRVRPEIVLDADHHPLLSPEAFAGVNVSRIKRFKEFRIAQRRRADSLPGPSQHAFDGRPLAGPRQRRMGDRAEAAGASAVPTSRGAIPLWTPQLEHRWNFF